MLLNNLLEYSTIVMGGEIMQYRVYLKVGNEKFFLVLSDVHEVNVYDGIYQVYSVNNELLFSAPKEEVIAFEKV